MTKKLAIVAAAVVVAAVALVATVVSRSGIPDDAAFVIGDRVVTKSELSKRVDALRALYGIEAPNDAEGRDEFRRSSAKSFAVTLILDAEAENLDITVSDKKARDLLDKFIAEKFGTRDAFVESLGNVRTSEAEVLDEIRRQELLRRLRTAAVGEVTVSDIELRTTFDQRKESLASPEKRQLKNIVVADEAQADDIAAQLKKGADIAKLAASASIDESTRSNGGDLGFLSRADLEPSVGEATFGVKKGEVYGPVEGSHGWNVGIVVAIRAPQPADFSVMGEQYRQVLKKEKEDARWEKWLEDVIGKSKVEYADDYRPEHPDAPPPEESGQ